MCYYNNNFFLIMTTIMIMILLSLTTTFLQTSTIVDGFQYYTSKGVATIQHRDQQSLLSEELSWNVVTTMPPLLRRRYYDDYYSSMQLSTRRSSFDSSTIVNDDDYYDSSDNEILDMEQQRTIIINDVGLNRTNYRTNNNTSNISNNSHRTDIDILWSYVYNLQRVRRQYYNTTKSTGSTTTTMNHQQLKLRTNYKVQKLSKIEIQTLQEPVISLLFYLKQDISITPIHSLLAIQEPFERSIIQAIRISSMTSNYRLITEIVQAAIQYSIRVYNLHSDQNYYYGIFNPRIIGEAITEMHTCQASLNKIKSLWTVLMELSNNTNSSILSRPISAYEVNCLLQIYIYYNKPRAAIDLYYYQLPTMESTTKTDTYSVCLVLQALTASVVATTVSSTTNSKTLLSENKRKNTVDSLSNESSTTTVPVTTTTPTIKEVQNKDLVPLLSTSSSWQWKEAIQLIDQAITASIFNNSSQSERNVNISLSPLIYSNHIWTSILQLNDACSSSSNIKSNVVSSHDGIKVTTYIIYLMQKYHIQPDTITSTLLLSGFKQPQYYQSSSNDYYCNYAVALLRNATSTLIDKPQHQQQQKIWTIAKPPNMYMYSAVMSLCASCKQYDTALELLQQYENSLVLTQNDDYRTKTTYLYNSVLQALTTKSTFLDGNYQSGRRRKIKKSVFDTATERTCLAFELYHRMTFINNIQPDAVTYNTLLSILARTIPYISEQGSDSWKNVYNTTFLIHPKKPNEQPTNAAVDAESIQRTISSDTEKLINAILDNMEEKGIDRETSTYRSATRVIVNSAMSPLHNDITHPVMRLMKRAIRDKNKSNKKKGNTKNPTISMIDVFNECLLLFAGHGNISGVLRIVSLALQNKIELNTLSWVYIIQGLGSGSMTSSIPVILSGQVSSNADIVKLSAQVGLDWSKIPSSTHLFDTNHFSTAISCCLQQSDFESAKLVLSHMRSIGIRPTPETLADISRSYAIIALAYNRTSVGDGNGSLVRARSSYTILSSIKDPSNTLVAVVCKACCSAGMFREAQSLLRQLHKQLVEDRLSEHNAAITYKASSIDGGILMNQHLRQALSIRSNDMERVLSSLHQDLLRICADQGNVTNALSLCEDIQYISKQLLTSTTSTSHAQSDVSTNIAAAIPIHDTSQTGYVSSVGMTISGWKSLLIAASKSGHWRVCVSTLQFLRPHLEATRPSITIKKEENIHRSQSYGQLEIAINTAVKCLAVRSQYGWIVRVIDDWIEWSQRRPPRDAALAAIRALAARGRGEEVNNLLTRCTMFPSSNTKYDDKMYNTMLFVGAITALYNEGLYDEADDAFVTAITQNALPFNVKQEVVDSHKRTTLDLHGMNLAVAHSAVRIALQQLAISADNWNRNGSNNDDPFIDHNYDMVIITGRGLNSALRMRPVLRPVVQRMLVEEFYPPLGTISVPGNMGAIRISSNDIQLWLHHQRQQKGARLLLVAAMLRNIVSPGSRLRAALAQHVAGTTFSRTSSHPNQQRPNMVIPTSTTTSNSTNTSAFTTQE